MAQFHTDKLKISVLFLTKSRRSATHCASCWWGSFAKATLTLGDNRRVNLSQTMIFMTSNLGGREITELMTRGDRISAGSVG